MNCHKIKSKYNEFKNHSDLFDYFIYKSFNGTNMTRRCSTLCSLDKYYTFNFKPYLFYKHNQKQKFILN